eukprot:8526406-Pyramimonas_sp.AAC.1
MRNARLLLLKPLLHPIPRGFPCGISPKAFFRSSVIVTVCLWGALPASAMMGCAHAACSELRPAVA